MRVHKEMIGIMKETLQVEDVVEPVFAKTVAAP